MKLTFRVHALQRMFQRSISPDDVSHAVATGESIADYPDDTPFPSRLLLAWAGKRPLHVVAAYNAPDDETIIVTVYEPDPAGWSPDFRSRKP